MSPSSKDEADLRKQIAQKTASQPASVVLIVPPSRKQKRALLAKPNERSGMIDLAVRLMASKGYSPVDVQQGMA